MGSMRRISKQLWTWIKERHVGVWKGVSKLGEFSCEIPPSLLQYTLIECLCASLLSKTIAGNSLLLSLWCTKCTTPGLGTLRHSLRPSNLREVCNIEWSPCRSAQGATAEIMICLVGGSEWPSTVSKEAANLLYLSIIFFHIFCIKFQYVCKCSNRECEMNAWILSHLTTVRDSASVFAMQQSKCLRWIATRWVVQQNTTHSPRCLLLSYCSGPMAMD